MEDITKARVEQLDKYGKVSFGFPIDLVSEDEYSFVAVETVKTKPAIASYETGKGHYRTGQTEGFNKHIVPDGQSTDTRYVRYSKKHYNLIKL